VHRSYGRERPRLLARLWGDGRSAAVLRLFSSYSELGGVHVLL